VALPWLIRNAALFGNPFHFAGSGGMLRLSTTDPLTYSVLDFMRHYGVVQPIGAFFEGFVSFFTDLHFFEHGLEIVPLALACVALGRGRRFYNSFIAGGIGLTFLICCYQEHLSWGGIRYFSPIIPFVYAYGVHEIVTLFNHSIKGRVAGIAPALRFPLHVFGFILCAAIALFPVAYPHRFYERKYSVAMQSHFPLADYAAKLSSRLPQNGSYLSFSMAQLNFQWRYDCVGVQEFFDSTEVPRAMRTFRPTLAVFTRNELAMPRIKGIFRALQTNDYAVVAADSIADVSLFTITRTIRKIPRLAVALQTRP
jgi:hypothetical protein